MFKDANTFEHRQRESNIMCSKYRDRIPVIVERRGEKAPNIDKRKFMVPCDITGAQFIYIIRRRVKLLPEQALFMFVNNTLITATSTLGDIYSKQKDEDGFLYVAYDIENTFG